MKLPLVRATVLMAAVCTASIAAARPPEGGYFAFGVGYAAASGDRGVPLKHSLIPTSTPGYDEVVRTDFGSGMGFDIRFGWLIGPIAPEISMSGHGNFKFEDGAGYPSFAVRFHPLLLADSLAAIAFDTSVFIGAGYVIGGYQPKETGIFNDDGKGWDGWDLTFGLGVTYDLSARVRIGLDFRCLLPQYSRFMIDWDDDVDANPTATPSTFVFLPTLQIVASF